MSLFVRTPSRLHFGLLSYGTDASRQFGGVGLAIERPGIELSAVASSEWSAVGPLADRTLRIAHEVAARLLEQGVEAPRTRFCIDRAAPEHAGLGTGTQLSLAVTRALTTLAGLGEVPAAQLARLSGRGQRSGVGLHGFDRGGFIVDGGRNAPGAVPPLLARLEFPRDWAVLVVIPTPTAGLHGATEVQAFAQLPPIPVAVTDRLCRLVLLGLMPAVVEADLDAFGDALSEMQSHVGACFAPAQGGHYARPEFDAIVAALRDAGLKGVGQSSWGPALYGFSRSGDEARGRILRDLSNQLRLGPGSAFWTRASQQGACISMSSH